MFNQRETNPHFSELENPPFIEPRPRGQHGSPLHFPTEPQPRAPARRERASPYHVPAESQPDAPPQRERRPSRQVPPGTQPQAPPGRERLRPWDRRPTVQAFPETQLQAPPRAPARREHASPYHVPAESQPDAPLQRERRPSHQVPPGTQPQAPPRRERLRPWDRRPTLQAFPETQLQAPPRQERRSRHQFPIEPQPHESKHKDQSPTRHSGATPMISPHQSPSHTDQQPQRPSSRPTNPHFAPQHLDEEGLPHNRHPSVLRVPSRSKTAPLAWLVAAFCALFWIIIIVGGLIVLIIYLAYKPRSPKFDLAGASLNAAYLDMGYLLNGDLTLLANFTNANKKMSVDFSYIVMDLYFSGAFIATTYVDPLSVLSRQSRFQYAHFTPSQVKLTLEVSQEMQRQVDSGRVKLEIKAFIKTKSKLGGIFKYSYWLYSNCNILVVSPPNGPLLGHRCVTKH